MIIQAAKPKEKMFYPDIQDNLQKEEKNRFGFKLRLPSISKTIKAMDHDIEDGEMKQVMNVEKYMRVHVVDIMNAPDFQVGSGQIRKLTIDDIFKYPELDSIYLELLDAINEFKGVDAKK